MQMTYRRHSFTTNMTSYRSADPGGMGRKVPTGEPKGNPQPACQTALEPGAYTISFDIIPPSDGLGCATQAIITAKVDGMPLRRVISVFNGAAITVVADAVEVQLVDVSSDFIIFDPPQEATAPYIVTTGVEVGTRGTVMQPPVLVEQVGFSIDPSGNVSYDVPQDSGVISVFIAAGFNANTGVTPFDGYVQMFNNGQFVGAFNIPQTQGWIPLVPGTTQVVVNNLNSAFNLNGNLVWGIEG